MDVMELIPNRFPIYYIDAVESLELGKNQRQKNLTANEDFQGYFPMNRNAGYLILETLAQAGSVLTKSRF